MNALLSVPRVTASDAVMVRGQSYATLGASLPFWAPFHEGFSEGYWLLLSYLKGFGGT